MAKKGKYTYEWPRPMVTVDALIFTHENGQDKVLLIKRGIEPFKDRWAIPGGFVEMNEDLVDAAKRELEEETGLKNINLTQFQTFGKPGRDPRGRLVTIVFIGKVPSPAPEVLGGDDAADAKWFAVEKLPKMAFDHEMIIKMGLEYINKL